MCVLQPHRSYPDVCRARGSLSHGCLRLATSFPASLLGMTPSQGAVTSRRLAGNRLTQIKKKQLDARLSPVAMGDTPRLGWALGWAHENRDTKG